jgi:hypothetical protein
MPMIRHLDPTLSIGFEGDSLTAQMSSCTTVPQQKFPSRIARPNAYVVLSLSNIQLLLISFLLRTLISHHIEKRFRKIYTAANSKTNPYKRYCRQLTPS